MKTACSGGPTTPKGCDFGGVRFRSITGVDPPTTRSSTGIRIAINVLFSNVRTESATSNCDVPVRVVEGWSEAGATFSDLDAR